MDKNSRDPVHCWLVWGKVFHAAVKYLYAGLEETGIDDTDFRILEVLLNKRPLPMNTIGPKVHLTPGSSGCLATADGEVMQVDSSDGARSQYEYGAVTCGSDCGLRFLGQHPVSRCLNGGPGWT
jgi:hypothetical protein